jgi:hypothetical protein
MKYHVVDFEKVTNLEWLWENKQLVHYFGLGFIQLKLSPSERVHFYTTELNKTVGDEEIHDHRYDFVSTIVKGRFSQTIYDVNIVGMDKTYTHLISEETCSTEKQDDPALWCATAEPFYHSFYEPGQSYFMDSSTFHTVEAEHGTVTYLRRTDYKKKLANVVRPVGQPLVCPFSVKLTEDEIFDHLKQILG